MICALKKVKKHNTDIKKIIAGGFLVFSERQQIIHAVLTAFI